MAHDTRVYHVVGVDDDGEHVVLVFKKPREGEAFSRALKVDRDTGALTWFANSAGVLPHREPEDYGPEGGGLTWRFPK